MQNGNKMKHSMIPTNGITMHVVEYGEGQPVLFCHGFPDIWRRQIEAVGVAIGRNRKLQRLRTKHCWIFYGSCRAMGRRTKESVANT
jgi:pimeloyl-ACP methyl ester carboxylesterase